MPLSSKNQGGAAMRGVLQSAKNGPFLRIGRLCALGAQKWRRRAPKRVILRLGACSSLYAQCIKVIRPRDLYGDPRLNIRRLLFPELDFALGKLNGKSTKVCLGCRLSRAVQSN